MYLFGLYAAGEEDVPEAAMAALEPAFIALGNAYLLGPHGLLLRLPRIS